ncbi:membrane-targeted effector domain-containing toxin [Pseudomonas reactans]|uniref:membrane-targeted effector domain-containing toxin n=1 Tax=Pseudomonas reactans TaxID=117680 RepID=UPI0021093D2C|nr:membrane-targeted effector domain-containing toxin [Pseudomonas reactans]
MKTASTAPTATTHTHPLSAISWDTSDNSYILQTTKDRFTQSVAKDLNSGRMSPDVNKMVDAVMWPGKGKNLQVQVKTFAVDGIQAKDIIFIQRAPPVSDGPNIVVYVPEKDGSSFQSFKTVEEMNTWLKTVANDPQQLEAFSQHFAEGGSPARTARVINVMSQFKDNEVNAVVGPYANEGNDIFARLDKDPAAPPASVNGLMNVKHERTSPEGRALYSGQKNDGEKVFFQYDAYGNFLGEDQKSNFYFVKNGLNNTYSPLVPMTLSEFNSKVYNEAADKVGANDIRGLYEELLTHLEHPASGISDALRVFGVNRNTADTVERYFDNPFSALLLDLNTNNQIGKVFGVDKSKMDSILGSVGDIAQGFVPYYGLARGLGSLLAKALRNEPLSVQEKKDLADGLALKPNSAARKNLPGSQNSPYSGAQNKPAPKAESEVHNEAPVVETGNHPGMKKITFEGRDYFVSESPDAGDGQHYLLRLEKPGAPTELVSSGKIAKPDEEGVWKRRGVSGGGVGSSKSQPFDPGAYDYPAEGEPSSSAKTNEKIDKQLKHDANNYHKNAKTIARPVLPELPPNASPTEVIKTVYKESPGMIIGEDHTQSAGIRFLIDNAGEFKKNGVTTLYSEGFDHALQPDLDRFFKTGEFSPELKSNLKLIDRAHSGHGAYTNRELLLTMRKHGISVKAIDVPSVEPKSTRLKNMNYYASKLIERDQAVNPQGKWVARVGSDHVFTYDGEPPIRGISQLTGATGVSIDTAVPNKGTSVIQSRDKTELYIEM